MSKTSDHHHDHQHHGRPASLQASDSRLAEAGSEAKSVSPPSLADSAADPTPPPPPVGSQQTASSLSSVPKPPPPPPPRPPIQAPAPAQTPPPPVVPAGATSHQSVPPPSGPRQKERGEASQDRPAAQHGRRPKAIDLPAAEPKRRTWLSRLGLTGRRRRLAKKQAELAALQAAAAGVSAERAQQRRKMPSWLVSFIVHLMLLLTLALVPIQQFAAGPITLFLGQGSSPGIAEFELGSLSESTAEELLEDASDEMVSQSGSAASAAELLDSSVPQLDVAASMAESLQSEIASASEILTSSVPRGIAGGLTGRSGAMKQALLDRFGGTAATEDAVEMGLQWLVNNQRSDGSWSLVGPYASGGVQENRTAATALALNAFLGAGYTHKQGRYRNEVALGLKFLLRRQDEEGFFPLTRASRNEDAEPSRQRMYAQAIASITVAEAYGMTADSNLRVAAERAMKFAQWSQSDLKGWRYDPRNDADMSVTGWFLMALITGKMAGLQVDDEVVASVGEFLDSVQHDDGARYAYKNFEPPSLSMTAEGLLCRIYLGWPKSHPALLRGIEVDLLPNRPSLDQIDFSVYYWYYATQVMHHVGGPAWQQWNESMRRVLPRMQEQRGPEKGSWDPTSDAFGASGGRLYTTCLCIYCLEVYYRHLAIYDVK